MIAAFARAARVLVDSPRREVWRRTAERAAEWLRDHLWNAAERRLLRRYRDGEAAIDGFCEDYAYLTWGLIELFQATGQVEWLDWALELTAVETELFYDERDGGWFSTTGQDASVLLRLKEDYDGAEPAAASVTVGNLIVLGRLVADTALVDRARRTLERYGPEIGRAVRVMPLMVSNIVLWHTPDTEIVVAGNAGEAATIALERVLARHYLPASVVVPLRSGEARNALARRLPWLAAMDARAGAAAYVCHNFTCRTPVTDPEALEKELGDVSEPRRIMS